MAGDLKACPCVAEVDCTAVQQVGKIGVWERYQAQCGACGRRGPIVETEQEAIDSWNTPGPLMAELVEHCRKVVNEKFYVDALEWGTELDDILARLDKKEGR